MIEVFPFMLRVSKHSEPLFSHLLVVTHAFKSFRIATRIYCLYRSLMKPDFSSSATNELSIN